MTSRSPLLRHEILLIRAGAVYRGDHIRIALCDRALERELDPLDLDWLEPDEAVRIKALTPQAANAELDRSDL